MKSELKIRESAAEDADEIEALYPRAFPDEDLIPLVRSLHGSEEVATSIVGVMGLEIVGHALFTRCELKEVAAPVALLGPLVVATDRQKQGIGASIVDAGLSRVKAMGVCVVLVLGDPEYYKRFGFLPELNILPPYPLKPEWMQAWQSLRLGDEALQCTGKLLVPWQWSDPTPWM